MYHQRHRLFIKNPRYTFPRHYPVYTVKSKEGYINEDRRSWLKKGLPAEVRRTETLENVGIPGFSYIFSRSASNGRRLFWVISLVVSTAVFIYEMGLLLDRYFNSDPSLRTSNVPNATLAYPSITICPNILSQNPRFNLNKDFEGIFENSLEDFNTIIDVLKDNVSDLDAFWQNDLYEYMANFSSFMEEDRSVIKNYIVLEDGVRITYILSPTGRCISFYPGERINLYTKQQVIGIYMKHLEESHFFIEVLTHPVESVYQARYFVITKGIETKFCDRLVLEYKFVEMHRMNLPERPCRSAEEVDSCIEDCLERFIYSHSKENFGVSCRLPFMIDDPKVTVCERSEIRRMYEGVDKALQIFDKQNCHCPKKCRELKYILKYLNIHGIYSNTTVIHVYRDKDIALIEEYWAYQTSSLMADIGGSLGLFLGISLLSLVEILEAFTTKLF